MASSTEAITSSLQLLDEAKQSYLAGGANSTEAVLDAARAILVAGGEDPKASSVPSNTDHEKPSDFLQRACGLRYVSSHLRARPQGFLFRWRTIFPFNGHVEVTLPTLLTISCSPFCHHFWSLLYKQNYFRSCVTLAPPV